MNSHLVDRRRRILVVVAAFAVVMAGLVPAPVHAAPEGEVGVATGPTIGLRSLGFGQTLGFYGLQGEVTLTIPVPVGALPEAITGIVQLPPNLLRGEFTVIQDDRTLSRVALPDTDRSPISIPLAGANVVDNAITVRLHANLVPPPDYCLYDPANPLRLVDTAISFTGTEKPPTTVAEFLPPILQKLTIFIPSAPTPAESDAAIRLTTTVLAHYSPQTPAVSVVALDGSTVPPAPAALFERQIVVRDQKTASVALQPGAPMPSLLIGGTAGDITNQVRFLTSDLSRLALSSLAVVGPIETTAQLPTNVTTIRDLGQPGVNATALTNPRVTIPLDQTRLGRPVKEVRVHLQGSYTPLPATLGGQVVVSVGNDVVVRWEADSTGSIDRWVDIPDRLLTRYTNLDVEVQAAGNTGRCGEFQPITLIIDGATAVQSSLADPPTPLGFQSLPQALMPRVLIGMNPSDQAFADTVRASTILEGLQRLSNRPLDTEVVPFDTAVASATPAVLISADGWKDDRITLPVTDTGDGKATALQLDGAAGGPATLKLEPGESYGTLQTVASPERSVLVATSNGDAAQLDSLLSWLDGDSQRWSQLDGTAVIAVPGHDPVTLKTEPAQQPIAATTRVPSVAWWIGGAVLALAALVGLLAVRTRRRKSEG